MLVFSTQFVKCCPSNLLSGSNLPPFPFVKVQYMEGGLEGEGGRGLEGGGGR
jgi:hypothetical protein